MKRIYFSCLALLAAAAVSAQDIPDKGVVLDLAEDTTQVVTVTDIIEVQEMVSSRNSSDSHFKSVWSRNAFFNIYYGLSGEMSPQGAKMKNAQGDKISLEGGIPIGPGQSLTETFKKDLGVGLTLGNSYKLHKKPIANVAQFNLDWTFFNIYATRYKATGAKYCDNKDWTQTDGKVTSVDDGGYQYFPWNREKWEASFSWELGPSLTLAPFTYIGSCPGLHFLKFNVYYRIGYEVSGILVQGDKNGKYTESGKEDKATTFQWGHGLTNNFGFNMSWKTIGIGLEWCDAEIKNYMPTSPSKYGKIESHFNNKQTRLYLTIKH